MTIISPMEVRFFKPEILANSSTMTFIQKTFWNLYLYHNLPSSGPATLSSYSTFTLSPLRIWILGVPPLLQKIIDSIVSICKEANHEQFNYAFLKLEGWAANINIDNKLEKTAKFAPHSIHTRGQ